MLKRKLFRTMWQYKSQFISMIIMITLGVGLFVGFNMEWYSIEKNTNYFYELTGYADYRIIDEKGFSEKDLQKVEAIDGVDAVSRYMSVNVDVKDQEGDTLSISVTENPAVSFFVVMDGEAYDSESIDGIWLSDKYAEVNGIAIGDSLTLKYSILQLTGTVKGLIESSEYMICVRDETQLMPDYATHGFAYISPAMFKDAVGMNFYPQLNVLSKLSKEEITMAVDEAIGKTSLILTKDETISYAGAKGEMEEGKTMANILPVVFLLIAVLTMVTTMHRVTIKERTQIGTLKALGFKNKKILRHYVSYAFAIGIIGTVLGILLGYPVAGMIVSRDGMMGTYLTMPRWDLYIPAFCYGILVAIIALLTFIGYLSVNKLLRGSIVETLHGEIEEKQRTLLLEKSQWFHRQSFGTRWNMRDIARHKSRTAMSLIGVMGCTMIIIAVLGMNDTMNAFLDSYYNDALQYSSRIYLEEDINSRQVENLTAQYGENSSMSMSVQLNEKAVSLEIYNLSEELIRFPAETTGFVSLEEDGAYVCRRLADEFGLSAGDLITVSPYGTDDEYELKVLGVSRSVTESILLSSYYAEQIGITYKPDSIYTMTDKADISAEKGIKSIQSKQMIIDSFDSFMEILYAMIILMIGGGIILGVVVLYNLGTMSYAERYREMATLKVLGFKDKKIGQLLTSQNLWLSVVGLIIGIPCGSAVLGYLLYEMAGEYELLKSINLLSYVITVVLTLGISLLVSLMVSRKNKKIDMVEALKSAE